ncbi:MAG: hypothetical protein KDC49_05490 [Saprospiraceae bacterium]|nr:hypothetical protein [Saprospiraceae bacterium]
MSKSSILALLSNNCEYAAARGMLYVYCSGALVFLLVQKLISFKILEVDTFASVTLTGATLKNKITASMENIGKIIIFNFVKKG